MAKCEIDINVAALKTQLHNHMHMCMNQTKNMLFGFNWKLLYIKACIRAASFQKCHFRGKSGIPVPKHLREISHVPSLAPGFYSNSLLHFSMWFLSHTWVILRESFLTSQLNLQRGQTFFFAEELLCNQVYCRKYLSERIKPGVLRTLIHHQLIKGFHRYSHIGQVRI